MVLKAGTPSPKKNLNEMENLQVLKKLNSFSENNDIPEIELQIVRMKEVMIVIKFPLGLKRFNIYTELLHIRPIYDIHLI